MRISGTAHPAGARTPLLPVLLLVLLLVLLVLLPPSRCCSMPALLAGRLTVTKASRSSGFCQISSSLAAMTSPLYSALYTRLLRQGTREVRGEPAVVSAPEDPGTSQAHEVQRSSTRHARGSARVPAAGVCDGREHGEGMRRQRDVQRRQAAAQKLPPHLAPAPSCIRRPSGP
jgi:hypothetical protein